MGEGYYYFSQDTSAFLSVKAHAKNILPYTGFLFHFYTADPSLAFGLCLIG